ncbi:hypothetical protein HSIEG1_997 [Enterococcus sp. HSIEG1]|nr:hypothetical protein HSIEG1_997 [Enterococcus sp. HSIEG1]
MAKNQRHGGRSSPDDSILCIDRCGNHFYTKNFSVLLER